MGCADAFDCHLNLWVKGYDWDQPLSNTETIQWQNTCDKSTEFSKSIPRHAPSHAFAACNYVRCVDKSTINSHLLVHALAEDRVAWTEPCSKPIPTQVRPMVQTDNFNFRFVCLTWMIIELLLLSSKNIKASYIATRS
ncbi:hypothetical protein RB195_021963 [Necator americanus]|uniref:Uncharacterized protein n=1 Tax=Necator americanus TaxID=51031 RepID=A0ABR1EDH0_NECAM